MKEYTKIGFIYVIVGLACFAALTALVALAGWYETTTGVGIATAVMSAIMMQACRAAYIAGKRSASLSE